jgi:hypothetical protein
MSHRVWRCVSGQVVPDMSKYSNGFIFRAWHWKKMKALWSSKTFGTARPMTGCHIPKLQQHYCENPKSYRFFFLTFHMILIKFFADNEIEMKLHGAFAFHLLSQFTKWYKGVYSENSLYFKYQSKNSFVYVMLFWIYTFSGFHLKTQHYNWKTTVLN